MPRELAAADLSQDVMKRMERLARAAEEAPVRRRDTDFRAKAALDHWMRVCPVRYHDATRESLAELLDDEAAPFPRAVHDEVMAWIEADPPPGNVVITGDPGVGKSWLAAVMCMATAELYAWHNEYVGLARMFIEDNQSMGRVGGLGSLDRYVRAHLLVIDDVGSGRQALTESQEERLYVVVNERWEAKRPTIVTTNLTQLDLFEYLGVRIAERIKHGAIGLKLVGKSRRESAGSVADLISRGGE